MEQKKKNILIGASFIVVLFMGTFINTYIHSADEYHTDHHFVINKIEVTPTRSLEFYGADHKKISLWNYTINSGEGITIGDSICKARDGYYLYIFKKNSSGRYGRILRFAPNGMFTKWLFRNATEEGLK